MKKIYLLSIALILMNLSIYSQGDDCASATPLTVGSSCSYTNADMSGMTTQYLNNGTCSGTLDDDVYFSFTATSSNMTITVDGSANYDAVIGLLSGSCGSLTLENGCIDNTGSGGIETGDFVGLIPGNTYYILVYDWFNGAPLSTTFDICVVDNCPSPPANDDCSSAQVVTVSSSFSGTTECASYDPVNDPNPADVCALTLENTIWFSFTPATTEEFSLFFSNYSCIDVDGIQAGVFTGSCGGPYTNILCEAGSPPIPLVWNGTAGTTYYIVVDGNAGAECSFDAIIEPTAAPCGANSGSASINIVSGSSINANILCFNDELELLSNNDYVLPTAAPLVCDPNGPPPPAGVPCSSGVDYAIFTCPPTQADFTTDPCFSGYVWGGGEDFNDPTWTTNNNNGGIDANLIDVIHNSAGGPVINNTLYFAPTTMDCIECNAQDADADLCIDLGSPIQMTYLEQITAVPTQNCNGSVTIAISGGYPEFFNGNYNIVNTGSGNLSSSTISTNGGTIDITGLSNSDNWSIDVTDDNGCPVSFNGTYTLIALVSALPDTATLCSGEIYNLDGAPSGGTGVYSSHTWTGSTAPLSSTNTQTSTFTAPTVSSTTSYVLNYTVVDNGGCSVTETINITVNPSDIAGADDLVNAICNTPGNTIDLDGLLSGNTAVGTWNETSSSGQFNAGTGVFDASNLSAGNYTFTYTVSNIAPCPSDVANFEVQVSEDLAASAASSSPTLCINTAMTNITHTTTGATGIGAASGLPAGVTANWSGGTITISGTPTASGTFNYTIPLTGPCGAANATGTITVDPDMTVSAPSSSPTLCINTAMTNITHTTTGATGIGAASGLPAGVTANWSGGTITISGTPTASGTFNYTIPLTGGCGTVNATGTITVDPDMTVSAPSSSPTLCINTAMTNITHTTTGATGIGAASGLPAGVTANWSGGTITISGTPTASGTFNYTIPLTGGCGTVNATGTITVDPDMTVSAASSSPTLCINTAMTNITHTTTGATGIGAASGLPAGVTANWSGGTITISGTPTASGTFNYTIPLTGGCGTVNATGTITVDPDMTVSAASSSPTLCINTAMTNITHTTTGATGIGAASGLPAGVTANWSGGTITISGTPTASGTFNYSIPLTGGCGTVNATGTITVDPDMTVSAASSSPTLCINTAMTNITHTTTGATGIGAASGLPAGVTANWSGGTITISGTPTASGTFNYTIPLTGGCGTVNATGTITVDPDMTVSAASSSPTLCINTAMTNITHTTTGATGIGAASGLPAGVTANWSGGTITISGTPTASGTFNYTIPLTGGCGTVNATGTITVDPDMTVSAASSSPTLCINTAMTNITHTTTGATGIGAASGLPAGVTANWSGGTITISGTPTASGTFNYSIPLTGGCGTVNATGTITVDPDMTVSAASSSPTLCINTAMTNITHTTTGATGIGAASGLPAGVTANWSGGTITISGTPTASGTFNYTIPLTGGCGTADATGTITVNDYPTAGISSASECENVPGSGQALNIDVTGLESAIHGSGTITWYTDNTYGTSYTPNNETVDNGEVFYFEITQNGCTTQDSITYTVSGNITLNDPAPEFCEDVAGGGSVAGVDLTTFNNSVFSGASSYTWATGPTGVTINDGDSINIQVQQGSCPVVDIYVHFTVNSLPTSNPASMAMCEDAAGSGQATFDLTTLDNAINGGSGDAVTWFTDAGTSSAIGTPGAYVSGNGTVYALVTNATTTCNDTAEVTLTINALPTSDPAAMQACDEGGNQATFDLTTLDNTINGGSGDAVTWFTDAATSNAIGTPGTYVTGTTTVYAVVTDGTTLCTDTAAVTLTVNPLPAANNTSINLCDDGTGQATFDLTSVDNTVNGGTGNVVAWFDDALATTPIGTPGAFVTGNDTVYAVVTDATTLCMDTTDVYLIIDPLPTANDQTPQLCEDAGTPGTAAGVDLTLLNSSIDGGAGSTLTWYNDTLLTSPVATPASTTVTNGQVFYVEVNDGTCTTIATVTYTVTSTITLTDPLPVLCEDAVGGGTVAGIDLTSYNASIYSGVGATFDWYTDAGLTTPVGTPTNVNASNGTIFYVDVTDGNCNNNTTLTFTINPQSVGTLDSTICNGDTVMVNGTIYSAATSLTGTEVFTAANNCDSTVTVTITELPLITGTLDSTICNGASFVFNGTTYDGTNNSGTETLTAASGCDSVITVTVTELPLITGTLDSTICNGDSFVFNGTTYDATNNSGTETLTAASGCDSVITVTVTELPLITGTLDSTICNGDSFVFNGTTYDATNNSGTETLTAASGCDSVITVTVTELPLITGTLDSTICNGDSFVFNGTTYDATNNSGTETLTAASGCDSVITVTVTELPLITGTLDSTICNGDSFVFNGTTYDATNNSGTETLTAASGCDSVVTVTVTVNPSLSVTPDPVTPICAGDQLILTATASGNGTITWYDTDGTTVIGTGSPFDATAYASATGTYTFYVSEEGACASGLSPVVVIVGGVIADISATPTTGFVPLLVTFTNGSTTGAGITYTWDFGDGTSDNSFEPSHTYVDINTYLATLTVSDAAGCSASANVTIEVIGESSILIPNVFTPNGDGQNDVFTVEGTNLESVVGEIYNRWGQKMFEWDNVKGYWDGRTLSGSEAPDGTYFYIVTAKGLDGTEYFKKGGFSLIR